VSPASGAARRTTVGMNFLLVWQRMNSCDLFARVEQAAERFTNDASVIFR
jgi:hypothetical protein